MAKKDIYIGTYTKALMQANGAMQPSRGEGIYKTTLDTDTGNLTEAALLAKSDSPSFLSFGKDGKHLYAVNETGDFEGENSGAVSGFAINTIGKTPLPLINQKPSQGANPCHIVTSPDGNFVLISNYSGGNLSVYALDKNGGLGAVVQHIQHHGKSINPDRQDAPYVHSLTFSQDGQYVYAADLGTDRLVCYRFDPGAAELLVEIPSSTFHAEPGSGPRHCVFSESGQFLYLLNELNHSINVLTYDSTNGKLTGKQTISTLPEEADAEGNTCADIQLSPNGKFLYASNRGHDSLAIYEVDQENGQLSLVDLYFVGKVPRSFLIDEAGEYLVCSNQESDQIISYSIAAETGLLTKVDEISVGSPVCVKML